MATISSITPFRNTKSDLTIEETKDAKIADNDFADGAWVFSQKTELEGVFKDNRVHRDESAGLSLEEIGPNKVIASKPGIHPPAHQWMSTVGNNLLNWDPGIFGTLFKSPAMKLGRRGWMLKTIPSVRTDIESFEPKPIDPDHFAKVFTKYRELGRRYIIVDEWGPVRLLHTTGCGSREGGH